MLQRLKQEALSIFKKCKAILVNLHVVYTSGRHGTTYLNKDAVYPHTHDISKLGEFLALMVADDNIEVVIGPTVGGVILSQWVAYHLTNHYGREVIAAFAEKNIVETPVSYLIYENGAGGVRGPEIGVIGSNSHIYDLPADHKLLIDDGTFVIKRGYDKLIKGKRCLVVDDVLTTGGSIAKVVMAVKAVGGDIVKAGCLVNRGKVTAEMIDVRELVNLIEIEAESFDESECLQCQKGVPVTTEVGKGKDYLAKKSSGG